MGVGSLMQAFHTSHAARPDWVGGGFSFHHCDSAPGPSTTAVEARLGRESRGSGSQPLLPRALASGHVALSLVNPVQPALAQAGEDSRCDGLGEGMSLVPCQTGECPARSPPGYNVAR